MQMEKQMTENPNANGEKRRLTPEDPVEKGHLLQLAQLRDARMAIGQQLLDLEQRKIQLLAVAKRIDDQNQRLFDSLLVDRGLAPGTPIELNGETGKISVIEQAAVHQQEPAEEEAPAAKA